MGAESVIHYMGGNRSFPVAGPIDDRRHRLRDLDQGDTAMFRTKDDYQQFHMTQDGGFWSGPKDKTLRLALIDKQTQQDQQQQAGQQSNGGSGGGGSGQQSGKKQLTGQQSVKKDNQQAKIFHHLTQDEAASSGTNVRHYLDDGTGYYEVNTDKNVYVGALKGKAQFAKIVTTAGPMKNGLGKIG
jgi:phage gp45-like